MTTIETIKAEVSDAMDHAKMKADAAKLQCALGKTELEDNLTAKRKDAADAAKDLSDYLTKIGATAENVQSEIASNVDNLHLQVALGKMEGEEAISQAKEKLTKTADKFEKSIENAKAIEADKTAQVKSKVSLYMEKVSSLKASLEAKLENVKANE